MQETREVMVDPVLNDRLINWARCYRDRPKAHATMLARMIALYGVQEEGEDERQEPEAAPVDGKDAALVERALCSPIFPERYQLLFCVLYLRPEIPVGRLRKAMHLQSRGFEDEVRKAGVMLSNVIEFYARDRRRRA